MTTRPHLHRFVLALTLAVVPVACAAQGGGMHAPPAPDYNHEPEVSRDTTWYTVGGVRHGVSYFPRVRHEGVEYEAGDELTFDRYHTVDVMYAWLNRWSHEYPDLVELSVVGESFEGRPILQATLTNENTGSHLDKPAAYFEGGRHSGEVTSSESVLWLMQHLLEEYGSDPEITALLDHNAIYLRPQNNPDGSNLYLHTAQANRSTVRPVDNDGDGLLDEDPPEDVDGDGVIYDLRFRPADMAPGSPGAEMEPTHVLDDRDESGRLMRRARDGEEAEWVVLSEGFDSDGDGRYNEDGIGGLDLHRNYPENWRPEHGLDRTDRGYTQGGAGDFPLSEPETRATVIWLLHHPHVSVVNSMDTRVPMHLRPPSTSRSEERMYPEDLAFYEYFDSVGLSITDYPWAGDVYETYMTRYPVSPWSGEPTSPSPLFGHGPDFGYFYYGSIWYGDELWNGGAMEDYNGDGILDSYDALVWDDAENGGRGFREWEPLHHPTLGDVELGGFHPKFFSQNGPPDRLEEWIRRQALFNLEMAKHLPRLEFVDVGVSAGDEGAETAGDSVTYNVDVTFRNVGELPTALRQAQLIKIVRPDRVRLLIPDSLTAEPTAEDGTPIGAPAPVEIVLPEVRDKTREAGYTGPGETRTVRLKVRVRGDVEPFEITAELLSTRGGRSTRTVELGG
ncbi:MAG: M14 family metallopeptidase [Longimicrobiales bacterium]